MSGGSMNHMAYATYIGDYNRIVADYGRDNLEKCIEIAQRAVNIFPEKATGGFEKFERDTKKLLQRLKEIDEYLKVYEKVLFECEWNDSGDHGIDQVAEALEALGK